MLTPEQQRSIYLYVETSNWAEVAREIEISEKTLWEWRKNQEYQDFYQKVVDYLNEDIIARLPKIECRALDTLDKLLNDPKVSPRERREAAKEILLHGRKCREYLLQIRLERKLEEAKQLRQEVLKFLNQENCLKL
ncbi:MAG: phBC6A51 family helix-turn-helix protein [Crocosphaera sp.]